MEMTCALKDQFDLDEVEYRLFGDSCYLAGWAYLIDEKFQLQTWDKFRDNDKTCHPWDHPYYQEYIDLCQ
jgi:hypothetical protein